MVAKSVFLVGLIINIRDRSVKPGVSAGQTKLKNLEGYKSAVS